MRAVLVVVIVFDIELFLVIPGEVVEDKVLAAQPVVVDESEVLKVGKKYNKAEFLEEVEAVSVEEVVEAME